ncbi:MAG: CAP domain-containing protein [Spirochaetota bacterium]|nr:CAP domain-containing protein [Spirochaetota bacterium]
MQKFGIISINLLIISVFLTTHQSISLPYTESYLSELLDENSRVKQLEEYKDNEETIKLKLEILKEINTNRSRHGLRSLKLDILACRIASKTASEAVRGNYFGHWNLRGEKPYHRYAFAGGMHHVSENAAMRWRSVPMEKSYENVLNFIIDSHMAMYNEKSPHDGHRKNILNPWHTHVGLGFSLIENNFRYYEEYLNIYLEIEPLQTSIRAGESVKISGRVAAPNYGIFFVVVYYEPFPSPMTPKQIAQKNSYSDFTDSRVVSLPFWKINYDDNSKQFHFSFQTSKVGLYYVQIYIKSGHTKNEKNRFITTKGLSPVSGIVIKAN